ncbi:MAG: formylglycine-generating enzyme family protein [Crocinitomicaceae bacterium]|nr:formylglycine-generating enzyme family protein [Crocinitomicaceae bacterium]
MRLKIAYNLFFILCAIGTGSCTKQEPVPSLNNHSSHQELSQEIVPIESNVKMVEITGGKYLPFYSADDSLVAVNSFLIDERPVTNLEFLNFIKANPSWRKSNVKRIFADSTYLRDWVSDTVLPINSKPDAPVCFVSWFAAKAYANAVGKRLPKLDEWEFVAMADEEMPNAREKSTYSNAILNLYLIKDRQYNAVQQSKPNYWGVYNMFDLIWEWTDDFNSVLVSGESRAGEYGDNNLVCAAGATNATDVLNYAAFMRFGFRTSLKANYTISNLGFRCAQDITK